MKPLFARRAERGEYRSLVQDITEGDKEFFQTYMRMKKDTYHHLLRIIENDITKKDTRFRKSITAAERLALTLRFLGHGDSQAILSIVYRIGKSTVCKIINETTQAIWRVLQPEEMPAPTLERFRKSENQFRMRWHFPNCVGAIDGKHVRITCPINTGSEYYNYKGFFSIVLLAVVDSDYNFLMVDVGGYGSQNDAGVFRHSQFVRALFKGDLKLPECKPVEENGPPLPHVIVGDEAFPLTTFPMRPFPGTELSDERAVYNYRFSRARRISENAFGILVNKWRIFHRPIQMSVENAVRAVKAACVLHNFVHHLDGHNPAMEQQDQQSTQTDYCLHALPGSRGNITQRAREIQLEFAKYFMTTGAVDWQMKSIGRG
ncbi:uncharacterized protein LOC135226753 [Macrobrachium nipponense]|uniref:uncharacterized protein LOC135226753 n=1 Tax=Macrobrachium nipponense TaxID=159736 RepID=UPI0030C87A6C